MSNYHTNETNRTRNKHSHGFSANNIKIHGTEYEEQVKWINAQLENAKETPIAELYFNLGVLLDYAKETGNGLNSAVSKFVGILKRTNNAKGTASGFIEHIVAGTAGESFSNLVNAIETFENYNEAIVSMVSIGAAYRKKNENTLYSAEIGNALTAIGTALKPKY